MWYSAVRDGGLSLFHFTPMVIWSSVRTDERVAAHLSGSGPLVDTHLSPSALIEDLFCGYPGWNQLRSYTGLTSCESQLSSYSANCWLVFLQSVWLLLQTWCHLSRWIFCAWNAACHLIQGRVMTSCRNGFIYFFLVLENCMYNIFNIRSNMSVWDHTHVVVESTMTSGHTYSVDITHAIWNTPNWYTHAVHHDCVIQD